MIDPILTVRQIESPYPTISSFDFVQTSPIGSILPVLNNEDSDILYFRLYNNFLLVTGVADALNLYVTVYDGASGASRSASLPVESQEWIHTLMNGFGEGASTPGLYTRYIGDDTTLGGTDVYSPEIGTDGIQNSKKLRAGSDNNGCGFIEFQMYARVPSTVLMQNYQFTIAIGYDFTS
jgi:hypothetical protein